MAKIALNEADRQIFRQELSIDLESNNLRSALKYVQPKPYWEQYRHRKFYAVFGSISFPTVNTILGLMGIAQGLVHYFHAPIILAHIVGLILPSGLEYGQYSFMKPLNQNIALKKAIDKGEIYDFIFLTIAVFGLSSYGMFALLIKEMDSLSAIVLASLVAGTTTFLTYNCNLALAKFSAKSKQWIIDNKDRLSSDQLELFEVDEFSNESEVTFKRRRESRKVIEITANETPNNTKAIENSKPTPTVEDIPVLTKLTNEINSNSSAMNRKDVSKVFQFYDNDDSKAKSAPPKEVVKSEHTKSLIKPGRIVVNSPRKLKETSVYRHKADSALLQSGICLNTENEGVEVRICANPMCGKEFTTFNHPTQIHCTPACKKQHDNIKAKVKRTSKIAKREVSNA